jgi:hypothetical protein
MVAVDTVLELLNEKRRRYTLYYLTEQNGPVHVEDVVNAVAEIESNPNSIELPENNCENIEISLRHNHFPKIDEVDFIEYNPDNMEIQLVDSPTKFQIITTVAKVLEET